jgi:hypothetical protein
MAKLRRSTLWRGPYRALEPDKVIEIVSHLRQRISERFPRSETC